MANITRRLHDDEEVIKKKKPSRWKYIWWYAAGVILLPLFLLGLVPIILAELKRRGHTYILTNQRLVHEYTFISQNISTTNYSKIQDVHMSRGLIQRFLGLGTIHINTAGTTLIEMKFDSIYDPLEVKKLIDKRLQKGGV